MLQGTFYRNILRQAFLFGPESVMSDNVLDTNGTHFQGIVPQLAVLAFVNIFSSGKLEGEIILTSKSLGCPVRHRKRSSEFRPEQNR